MPARPQAGVSPRVMASWTGPMRPAEPGAPGVPAPRRPAPRPGPAACGLPRRPPSRPPLRGRPSRPAFLPRTQRAPPAPTRPRSCAMCSWPERSRHLGCLHVTIVRVPHQSVAVIRVSVRCVPWANAEGAGVRPGHTSSRRCCSGWRSAASPCTRPARAPVAWLTPPRTRAPGRGCRRGRERRGGDIHSRCWPAVDTHDRRLLAFGRFH